MVIPERRLLEVFLRQALKDYIKLNPNSTLLSAEYFEDEGRDFKTAEAFIINGQFFEYGDWFLDLEELCLLLDIDHGRVKKYAYEKRIEERLLKDTKDGESKEVHDP